MRVVEGLTYLAVKPQTVTIMIALISCLIVHSLMSTILIFDL